MLGDVEAVRFIEELSSGRNRPWLIEAETGAGEVVEVVAKYSSAECGPGGLVREAYSAMLAADLGLPVSEPYVVKFSSEFIATLPSGLAAKVDSMRTAFGSKFVPNMLPFTACTFMNSQMYQDAAHAITFDAGIVNADRLVTKPNCLTDGRSLLLIDHELSLNLQGRGFLMLDPWTDGALHHMTRPPGEHLFYRWLKQAQESSDTLGLSGLCDALSGVSSARIDEYAQAIPPDWDADAVSADIARYLHELVQNADSLRSEVEALLSP